MIPVLTSDRMPPCMQHKKIGCLGHAPLLLDINERTTVYNALGVIGLACEEVAKAQEHSTFERVHCMWLRAKPGTGIVYGCTKLMIHTIGQAAQPMPQPRPASSARSPG
jgi:hypothetical protein